MLPSSSGHAGRARNTAPHALRRRLAAAGLAVALMGVPAIIVAPAAYAAPESTDTSTDAAPGPDATYPSTDPDEATTPAEEAPAEEAPAEEAPAEEAPAEETPTEEAPAEEAPAEETPADEAPAEETPAAPADPAIPAAPGTLTVVVPVDGDTVDPSTLIFTGTGITAGDIIAITYENEDGDVTSATPDLLPAVVAPDLTWSAPATFAELAEDQTDVEVTVTERDIDAAQVGESVVLTITIGSSPAPTFPFALIEPAAGSTIETYTPTLIGTAGPGEAIVASVTLPDSLPVIVGAGLADAAGGFSIPLDLGLVEQDDDGDTDITIDVTRVGADGTLVPDNLRSVDVTLSPGDGPFTPNAPSIMVVPDRITVSDAMNPQKGLLVSATGFDRNEDVTVTLVAPGGATIVFDEEMLELLGGTDETGTFEQPLFLFGTLPLGMYSVTIAGTDSGVSLTDTFELIADAVVPAPSVPVVPAGTTPTPLSPVTTDELAYTGIDALPLTGLAAAMLLAGAALSLSRRRNIRVARVNSAALRS